MDAIKALLKQIVDFWNGKDKRFKRNVLIIAGAVLTVVIILSVVLNQVDYATLYAGLDAEDSAAIIAALDTQNVTCKVEGDAIKVPAKDADRLRLSLSTEVKNGLNLDILAQGQGLGMSESDKRVYRKAYVEATLMNSIKTFSGIKDAKVMLTMPDSSVSVFNDNAEYATAGVILTPKPDVEITDEGARTIALFVEKAVPGLKLENISVMDNAMRIFDLTGEEKADKIAAEDRQKLQDDVRVKLRRQVLNLLQPVFGFSRVTAEVNVVLNFDTKTTDSVKFEPVVGEEGIVESIQKVREKIVNGTGTTSGEPGTTTNTGGTTTYPVVNAENGTYEKNAETINYEINEMKTHLEEAQGKIQDLSVAVVIDSTGMKEDFTDAVTDMVCKAVGVSSDFVSVNFMPMVSAQPQTAEVEDPAVTQQKNQQTRFYIIIGAIVFVVLLAMVLLFLGRKPKAQPLPEAAVTELPVMEPGMEYEAAATEEEEEQLAAIELVKDSSAKEQIGRLIEKNPELVANLLRTWLSEEQE